MMPKRHPEMRSFIQTVSRKLDLDCNGQPLNGFIRGEILLDLSFLCTASKITKVLHRHLERNRS